MAARIVFILEHNCRCNIELILHLYSMQDKEFKDDRKLSMCVAHVPYNPQSFEINAVIFSSSSLHTQGSNVILYGKEAKKREL